MGQPSRWVPDAFLPALALKMREWAVEWWIPYMEKHGGDAPDPAALRVDEALLLEAGNVEFHVGQGYEGAPAKAIKCAVCGSEQFHVGQGNYFTAIKCPNCGWELGIHEG